MAEREKIHFTRNSSYSNPKRSKIVKTTRGYVTKLNRDREKQYQTRRVKLVERDRKKALLGSVKPNKEKNKFNFLYWITCIVLFLILGSFAITGYVNSKITENQTEETITHIYRDVEKVNPYSTKLYNGSNIYYNIYITDFRASKSNNSVLTYQDYENECLPLALELYLALYSFSSNANPIMVEYEGLVFGGYAFGYDYNAGAVLTLSLVYSSSFYELGICFSGIILDSSLNIQTFIPYMILPFEEIGFDFFYENMFVGISTYNTGTFTDFFYPYMDYRYYDDIYGSGYEIYGFENYFSFFLGATSFIDEIVTEKSYSYVVKDINYDWQNKFSQLGHLKNIFNGNDKFYDASFNYYSSKRSLTLNSIKDSNYVQNEIEKYYLTDEKVKLLYDYGILSFSSKSKKIVSGGNPFKSEYYFYIVLDSDIVVGDKNISSAINYVNENYITSFNIDCYLEVQPSDFSLLSIFVFPIQVVYRIMYNFGVFVNFIISW